MSEQESAGHDGIDRRQSGMSRFFAQYRPTPTTLPARAVAMPAWWGIG